MECRAVWRRKSSSRGLWTAFLGAKPNRSCLTDTSWICAFRVAAFQRFVVRFLCFSPAICGQPLPYNAYHTARIQRHTAAPCTLSYGALHITQHACSVLATQPSGGSSTLAPAPTLAAQCSCCHTSTHQPRPTVCCTGMQHNMSNHLKGQLPSTTRGEQHPTHSTTTVTMSLKTGIVGLPNVGKSTLFNAICENGKAQAANFPFCTIEPNVGVVAVPDPRLTTLSDLSKSVASVPCSIEFVDIAGLVKGASKGEGLGNQFLANIREVDSIVQVGGFLLLVKLGEELGICILVLSMTHCLLATLASFTHIMWCHRVQQLHPPGGQVL